MTIQDTRNTPAGTRRFLPLLAVSVLAACLLAGFAQAHDAAGVESTPMAAMTLPPVNLSIQSPHVTPVSNGLDESIDLPCGSTKLKCYAEVKKNGYWMTTMIGYAGHPCTSPDFGVTCRPAQDTDASCKHAFPRYDIVDSEMMESCR